MTAIAWKRVMISSLITLNNTTQLANVIMKNEYITIEGLELYLEEMLYAEESGKNLKIVLLDGQVKELEPCKAKSLWDMLGTGKIGDAPIKGQFARLNQYLFNLAQVTYIDVKKLRMTLAFARLDCKHVELCFQNDSGFRAIAKAIKENKEIIDHQVYENYRCQTELKNHYEKD